MKPKPNYPVQLCICCKQKKRITKFPSHIGSEICFKCRGKEKRAYNRALKAGKPRTRKHAWAEEMRANPTSAEKHLWEVLRNFGGLFVCQMVVENYIADFYCPKFRLLVEIDESSHIGREDQDARRDTVLNKLSYRTMRFSNEEVLANRPKVIGQIMEAL